MNFLPLLIATTLAPLSADAAPPAPVELSEKSDDAVPGEWTLAERKQWKVLRADVAGYAKLMNESCGTSITVTFDFETFRGKLMEPGYTGLAASKFSSIMGDAVTAVRNLCLSDKESKEIVAKKIERIVLAHADGKRAHKLEKKLLTAVLDPSERPRDWGTNYREFLGKAL